jgi:hypothetical protein
VPYPPGNEKGAGEALSVDRIDVEPETSWASGVGIASVIVAIGLLIYTLGTMESRITSLENRVACLEHPHGASSAAVKRVGGRIVVVQAPRRTGCKP